MRTLVTGAAGFVGRHTVTELLARGHEVTAVVRPSSPVPGELDRPDVELVTADLRRPAGADLAEAIAGADALIHLAAGTTGSPRARFDATVLATERLISAIREANWRGRLVHVSSLAVYALVQRGRRVTIDERTPLEPRLGHRDDYAWTKGWQERLVRELGAAGPCAVTIVRPGAVHGPGRTFPARLGRRIGERTVLLLGGAAAVPLVQVDNLASLLAACAEHPSAAGLAINAVDPDPPRQWAYLRRWLHAQPGRVVVVPVPRALLRAAGHAGRLTGGRLPGPGLVAPYAMAPVLRSFRYDTTTASRLLGWHPPLGPLAALERTFAAEPPPAGPRLGSILQSLVGGS
jgi:nucleoside-diphosphate-sugar epimerase